MVNFYDRVVKTLSKDPSRRGNNELLQLEPWFRKRSVLFQAANITRDIILDVIKHCVFKNLQENEIVVLQGHRGDDFFILLRGKVAVMIRESAAECDDEESPELTEGVCDEEQREQLGYRVAVMGDGTSFGEQALINEDCIRTASIITEEATDLIVINRELYNRSICNVVQQEYLLKLEFVNESQLFRFWPNKWKKSIALALNKEVRGYEEVLIKQGDKADFLYFIDSGGVTISTEPADHKEQFKMFIQKCSMMFEDEEKAGIVSKYFTLSKWVSSKSRVADRLKQRVTGPGDNDKVASVHLPEFKVNLSPSDARRQAAIARTKSQKINICFLGNGQLCGDIEFLLALSNYHATAICQMQTTVFSLHRVVYERLFQKKNPTTLPIMTKNLGMLLSKRLSRTAALMEHIPLLNYILMMVEHLNGERIARRKVRVDGGVLVADVAVTRPKSLPSAFSLQGQRGIHDDQNSKPAITLRDFSQEEPTKSRGAGFSMDGIYLKLMRISEPGFTLEGSGISEEEYDYLVPLKKRLAKHLGTINPLYRKNPRARATPSKKSQIKSTLPQLPKNAPLRAPMKRESDHRDSMSTPKRNLLFHLPKISTKLIKLRADIHRDNFEESSESTER
ncbi:hypothetical protein CAPTEDRAFT_205292 [Capitella teleta]|uniref:Cyclic nucleotide-binding domain-containing protein n=1 Tax=Capitella teleta TaxID=283909 RepID=R7V7C6_CAPTE|nr:hypothetical protein CAPTEDRAFT_205292 [Capitella teleta]|eukprot:ELU14748.1 hypothetical protein CAPTEDRAFT_205292 [Capitella teleta]